TSPRCAFEELDAEAQRAPLSFCVFLLQNLEEKRSGTSCSHRFVGGVTGLKCTKEEADSGYTRRLRDAGVD
ncbi:uncharacterized, partial [Tachysurus ichikawai]